MGGKAPANKPLLALGAAVRYAMAAGRSTVEDSQQAPTVVPEVAPKELPVSSWVGPVSSVRVAHSHRLTTGSVTSPTSLQSEEEVEMNKRPTQRRKPTRASSKDQTEQTPVLGSRRAARRAERAMASNATASKPKRRQPTMSESKGRRTQRSVEEPKPAKRRRKSSAGDDLRMVHLAISPYLANILRTALTRVRMDDYPEVQQIQDEIDGQLKEMGLQ